MNTILLVLLTITLSTASLVRGQSFCISDLLPQYLTNGDFFSLQCNVPATTAGTNIMLGGRTGNPGDPMNQIYIRKGSVPANSKIYIQGPMDSMTASTSAPTNLTITEFTFVESLIEFFGFIPSDSIITISLCFMSRTTSHPSGDYGFLLHYYTLTFMARARLYVTQNTMKSYISGGAPMIVLQEGEMVLSINASLIIDNNIMEVGLAGAYNNAHISFQVNYQNTLSDGSLFAWRNNHFSGFCHTEFLTFWPVFSQSQGGDGGTVEISQNYFFYGPGTRYLNRMVGVSLPATFGPYMIGRIFVSFNTFNYSFPIQQDAEKGIIVVRPQTNFGGYYEIMHNVILDSTPPQCEVTSIYIEIPEATQWINITISDNTIVRQTAASRAFIYMTDANRLTSSSSILTVSRNNFTSLETSPTRYILDGAFPYSSDVIQVCENLWYDISATRFTDSLPWYQVVFSIIVFCSSDTIPTTSTTPINPPPTTTTPPPPSRTTSTNPALWTSSSSTAPSRLTTTSPEGTTTVVPTRIEQTKTRSLANYIDDDLLDIRIEVPAIPPDVTSAIVGAGIIGGGGTSAGDVQALAIVSMSSCTNPSKSYRDNMIGQSLPLPSLILVTGL